MAYSLFSPENSFVQFDETGDIFSCAFQPMNICLPMFYDDDVAFQFIVEADTPEEANALCGAYGLRPTIGLSRDCESMTMAVDDLPDIFRIDETHVLYNWSAGFPGFGEVFAIGECFSIMIQLGDLTFCSNCFYRIKDICWTSLLSYTNEDNYAGFNYCSGGSSNSPVDEGCNQAFFAFTDESTFTILYNASLQARFGTIPSVQVWIYDTNGQLVDMGIREALDTYPPSQLLFDFGGPASGVIRLSN